MPPASADAAADRPRTIHLADYQPWTHRLSAVALTFRLHPIATRVLARLHMRRTPTDPAITTCSCTARTFR